MDTSKRRVVLEAVVLGCAVFGTAMSVMSIEGASVAQVLVVCFSSFAAGAALTCLIGTVKRRRQSQLAGPEKESKP